MILIVDDHVDTCKPLQMLLRRFGYSAECVASGEEALRIMRANRPAAIVLDIMMPGMSGMEVLRTVKKDPGLRDMPVIVYSAGISVAHKEEARRLGVNDWLTKGQVKWRDLVDRLAACAGEPDRPEAARPAGDRAAGDAAARRSKLRPDPPGMSSRAAAIRSSTTPPANGNPAAPPGANGSPLNGGASNGNANTAPPADGGAGPNPFSRPGAAAAGSGPGAGQR